MTMHEQDRKAKALTTAQLVLSDQGYSVSLFAQAPSHLQSKRLQGPARQ